MQNPVFRIRRKVLTSAEAPFPAVFTDLIIHFHNNQIVHFWLLAFLQVCERETGQTAFYVWENLFIYLK